MSNEPAAEPKIEQWMLDAAMGIDANVSTYLGFLPKYSTNDTITALAQIIARHAPPCQRCQRLDAAIAHRDFIHVAELREAIDQ